MTIDLKNVLVVGDGASELRQVLPEGCQLVRADIVAAQGVDVVADEDRLPFDQGTFDLILAAGTLESIHDLPGALILMRRALRPGGLFLGAMVGGGSFGAFRALLQATEQAAAQGGAARFHPQVDVRSAGDLLFRAGYSTPVADMELASVRYSTIGKLLSDMRGLGLGNAFPQVQRLDRTTAQNLLATEGVDEQIYSIYLTGWAPLADEKRPSGPVKGFG